MPEEDCNRKLNVSMSLTTASTSVSPRHYVLFLSPWDYESASPYSY
jgi:hypothetical protein